MILQVPHNLREREGKRERWRRKRSVGKTWEWDTERKIKQLKKKCECVLNKSVITKNSNEARIRNQKKENVNFLKILHSVCGHLSQG